MNSRIYFGSILDFFLECDGSNWFQIWILKSQRKKKDLKSLPFYKLLPCSKFRFSYTFFLVKVEIPVTYLIRFFTNFRIALWLIVLALLTVECRGTCRRTLLRSEEATNDFGVRTSWKRGPFCYTLTVQVYNGRKSLIFKQHMHSIRMIILQCCSNSI